MPYLSALGDPKTPSVHRDGARVEAAEMTPDMATIPTPVTAIPGLLSQRAEAASVGTTEPGLQSQARNLNPPIDSLKSETHLAYLSRNPLKGDPGQGWPMVRQSFIPRALEGNTHSSQTTWARPTNPQAIAQGGMGEGWASIMFACG